MPEREGVLNAWLYCRIGSLERDGKARRSARELYCRIGSLEKLGKHLLTNPALYCRIGSLENAP